MSQPRVLQRIARIELELQTASLLYFRLDDKGEVGEVKELARLARRFANACGGLMDKAKTKTDPVVMANCMFKCDVAFKFSIACWYAAIAARTINELDPVGNRTTQARQLVQDVLVLARQIKASKIRSSLSQALRCEKHAQDARRLAMMAYNQTATLS